MFNCARVDIIRSRLPSLRGCRVPLKSVELNRLMMFLDVADGCAVIDVGIRAELLDEADAAAHTTALVGTEGDDGVVLIDALLRVRYTIYGEFYQIWRKVQSIS